jgi:Zn-dependent metalloprotease
MKNRLYFLSVLMLFMAMVSTVTGQNNPFGAKSKSLMTSGFMPKQAQPIPGLTSTASVRMPQTPAFHPASHPLPSFSPSKSAFSEKHYDQNGQVIFLSGRLPAATNLDLKSTDNLKAACFEYLEAIQADLRIQDARKEFKQIRSQTDEMGIIHVKLQQVFKDIPVYGGEIYLHASHNQIGLFNGNAYPTFAGADVNPSVGLFQARLNAIMDVSKRTDYHDLDVNEKKILHYDEPLSELVIYPRDRDPRQQYLAWHITIRPNFLERWEYFIDAKTGSVIRC